MHVQFVSKPEDACIFPLSFYAFDRHTDVLPSVNDLLNRQSIEMKDVDCLPPLVSSDQWQMCACLDVEQLFATWRISGVVRENDDIAQEPIIIKEKYENSGFGMSGFMYDAYSKERNSGAKLILILEPASHSKGMFGEKHLH